MRPDERVGLLKRLARVRNTEVELNGRQVPNSVSILLSMLVSEANPDKRYEIYEYIVMECKICEQPDLELEFTHQRYSEFRDITSLICYARSLISNSQFFLGLAAAREALDMAIREEVVINAIAADCVRESIRTKSVDAVNDALRALIASIDCPRTADSVLELEWMSDAQSLGADEGLLATIRSIANDNINR